MQHVDPERLSRDQLIEYVYNLEARLEEQGAVAGLQQTANLARILGLTITESRALLALADGRTHSKESILSALYFDRGDDAPEIKIVDVFICKIRRKLQGTGIVIETIWGVGYHLLDPAPVLAAAAGEEIERDGVPRPAHIGKPVGAKARPKGSVQASALAHLRVVAKDGIAAVTSRELTTATGGASGAAAIQNLAKGGYVEILQRASRHKQGDRWLLKLTPKAYGAK